MFELRDRVALVMPTGIVSAEMSQRLAGRTSRQACPQCSREDHDVDALHCKGCGAKL